MGDNRIPNKGHEAREGREPESLKASARLLADSQMPREIKISSNDVAKFSIDRDKVGDQNKYSLYTQYPNGVRMTRIESKGLLKPGESLQLEPPPGGTQTEQKDGSRIVKDASGKTVAKLDSDKTLHVYTKHGEFVERANGDVKYKPKDSVTDWQSLHKPGFVNASKFEDYGLSTNGSITRYPNGLEYDRSNNRIKIPLEHFLHSKDKEVDQQGNLSRVTVYGSDGKVLYTQDRTGLHVPTVDGVLTQTSDGRVTFEPDKLPSDRVAQHKGVEKPAPNKEVKQANNDKSPILNENSVPLWGLTGISKFDMR